MTTATEWIERTPFVSLTRTEERTPVQITSALAGAAWLVQAGLLAVLSVYLLSGATTGLLGVIAGGFAGTVALGPVLMSAIALVMPVIAAVALGSAVRRDGGSLPLTAASMVAAGLMAALAEMGLFALFILFFGS